MFRKSVNVLVLAIFVGLLTFFNKEVVLPEDRTTRVFGEVTADFGVGPKEPIFNSFGIAPGESEYKHITVINKGSDQKKVFLKAKRTTEINSNYKSEQLLDVVIEDSSGIVYGRGSMTGKKTLKDFYIDSEKGIFLKSFSAGESESVFIHVTYPETSGNAIQEQSVAFDISLQTSTKF